METPKSEAGSHVIAVAKVESEAERLPDQVQPLGI